MVIVFFRKDLFMKDLEGFLIDMVKAVSTAYVQPTSEHVPMQVQIAPLNLSTLMESNEDYVKLRQNTYGYPAFYIDYDDLMHRGVASLADIYQHDAQYFCNYIRARRNVTTEVVEEVYNIVGDVSYFVLGNIKSDNDSTPDSKEAVFTLIWKLATFDDAIKFATTKSNYGGYGSVNAWVVDTFYDKYVHYLDALIKDANAKHGKWGSNISMDILHHLYKNQHISAVQYAQAGNLSDEVIISNWTALEQAQADGMALSSNVRNAMQRVAELRNKLVGFCATGQQVADVLPLVAEVR